MNANRTQEHLPCGTRVLNTTDGEPGTILNGFSFEPEFGWYEYEVETRYGVERWHRHDFILFSDFDDSIDA